MIARRLVIGGRVQGVGYRAWLVRQAPTLAVTGWVRNCPDGTVEALVQGTEAAVDAAIAACRRGPSHAAVSAVSQVPAEPVPGAGFRQRPDAPSGAP